MTRNNNKMCRLIARGYQQMWQVLFPQGQSSNAVHVIFLKKKRDSIWFNSYRVLLSNLKDPKSELGNECIYYNTLAYQ